MFLSYLLSRKSKHTILSLCLILTLIIGFGLPAGASVADSPELLSTQSAAGAITDLSGHWASPQINEWLSKGLAQGYPDGTFKPDVSVTRAEFLTLTNRALGFQAHNPVNFSDVSATDWFAAEVAKAQTAGYINGYPDGNLRPLGEITRQEAAAMLTRAVKLKDPADFSALEKFKDAAAISEWGRGAASAVVSQGYMQGYPDQTFQANGLLSRAEAIVILNKALPASPPQKTGREFAKAGIYGPAAGSEQIEGDVTISAAGVTLQNMQISGNLSLTSGIRDGEVTLKNVTVNRDCTINNESTGARVNLSGSFNQVSIAAPKVNLSILSGSVNNLEVSEKAGGAVINIASSAKVSKLILNAAVSVTGKGSIGTAIINVSGSTLEPKPDVVEKIKGVTVVIGATTLSGGNKGTGPGTGTGNGNNPLNFVSSDPADGSTGVSAKPTISLTFDRGVTRDNWEHNQDCITLKNSSNQSVAITVFRSADYLTDENEKRIIYVTPAANLSAGKTYTLKIAADLKANNGNTLGEETTISFTVTGGGGGGGNGDGGGSDNDKSGADAALTIVDNKTAGAIIDLSLTACKNAAGTLLSGTKAVTITSDKDGPVFSGEETFTEGDATVTIEAGQVKTAGINTLTVVIDGVTPQPKVTVTVVPATQISSLNSSTTLDPALVKGGTSMLTVTLKDAYNNPLTIAVKNLKIVVTVTNNNATVGEVYQIDGEAISATTTLTKSGVQLDANGQKTYTLILPAVIDAGDGLAVQVTQNNDTAIGSAFSYLEPTSPSGEISAANSSVTIEPALAKWGTSNLTITLKDGANNPLADVTKNLKLVLTVVNADPACNEVYLIDGEAITATATLSKSEVLFDANGQKIYSVVLPATIDPGDGIAIQVTQKNGTPIGSAITYMEGADLSGVSAALAVAGDKTAGASFDLSITGAKDTDGTSISGAKAVSVTSDKDGLVFTGDVNFTEGAATVTLATGKVITAGSHLLTVEIAGITEQPVVDVAVIAASQISANNSTAAIAPDLTVGGTSTLTVSLKDAYNNPLVNTTKNLLIAVTVINNTATTSEAYTIDGTSVTATTTLTKSGLLFDGSGQKTFSLELPPTIDAGDGLTVQVTQNNGTPLGSSFAFYAE